MHNELNKLFNRGNKSILFIGIGNVLRQDDGVGVYISRRIRQHGNIRSLTVETGIENYIGKINCLNPDTLVFIDCLEQQSPPGTIKLLAIKEIKDLTFNTHNISLRSLTDFFKMPVFVLGIQPEKIDFGENISYFVKKQADSLIRFINKKEVHNGSRISM